MIYLQLIWSYLKIGLFGFGGGYAMLSLIEQEVVGKGWISEQVFTDIVAISQMTPGPIGINSATYIGYIAPGETNPDFATPFWGILGSVICTLVVVLPSFILVSKTSHFIRKHHESGIIKGIFSGLRPVVVGLIASAALMLINGDNFGYDTPDILISVAICIISFSIVFFTKIHPILVIACAGAVGWILYSGVFF